MNKETWLKFIDNTDDICTDGGSKKAIRAAAGQLAPLPPEVPTLPKEFVGRPDVIAALKEFVMHQGTGINSMSVTSSVRNKNVSNTTAAQGMGGVGK